MKILNSRARISDAGRKIAIKAALAAALLGCGGRTGLLPYDDFARESAYDGGTADTARDAPGNAPSNTVIGHDDGIYGGGAGCGLDPHIPAVHSSAGTAAAAHFTQGVPGFHFDTDVRVYLGLRLHLQSGTAVSGDPAELHDGDRICEGAVIRIAPSAQGIWAHSQLDILSPFPGCSGAGYCPAMADYDQPFNADRDVRWMGQPAFADHLAFAQTNDYTQDLLRGRGLCSFQNQPVTYSEPSGVLSHGKLGAGNVFCSGRTSIAINGIAADSADVAGSPAADIRMSGAGGREISVRLDGIECFAALEKRPSDAATHPEFYYLQYFAHNRPVIHGLDSSHISLRVESCP
ncbi:MAG: hypothetical protein U0R44_04985 [Candidatus Micrarchaeia archaeon]